MNPWGAGGGGISADNPNSLGQMDKNSENALFNP